VESAFATNGNVESKNFKFLRGENNLTEFKENDNKSRFFCQSCGAPIMAKLKNKCGTPIMLASKIWRSSLCKSTV
jgi:hypothetical protein